MSWYAKVMDEEGELIPENHPEVLPLLQRMEEDADESTIKEVFDENGELSGVSIRRL